MRTALVLLTLLLVVGVRLDPIRCFHGYVGDDGCECEDNYYGDFCETRFNCKNSGNPAKGERCDSCKPKWTGDFCDIIDCGENGQRSIDVPQTCICDDPFTGQFCTALNTSDVYRFYNTRVSHYIPLGVFIIIPASILIIVCNFCSRRRQVKRVENAVKTAYLKDVDHDVIESMMFGHKDKKDDATK